MRSQVLPALVSHHCFVIVFVCTTAAASPSALNLRGVAPRAFSVTEGFRLLIYADVGYYKSGSLLWCRDGSNRFSIDRLNDDFCDCPDGTDEPGTSACTNGRFYCSNQNRMPFWVFSSRVNDGICDCCDGSDEYTGKVQCGSVCVEGGKMPQVVLPSNPAREVVVKDKTKSLRVEQIENKQTDTRSKAHVVRILEMLELLFVIIALWQIYKWTFRSGTGLRRRLHH